MMNIQILTSHMFQFAQHAITLAMLASKQDDDRKEERLRHRWGTRTMMMIFMLITIWTDSCATLTSCSIALAIFL